MQVTRRGLKDKINYLKGSEQTFIYENYLQS